MVNFKAIIRSKKTRIVVALLLSYIVHVSVIIYLLYFFPEWSFFDKIIERIREAILSIIRLFKNTEKISCDYSEGLCSFIDLLVWFIIANLLVIIIIILNLLYNAFFNKKIKQDLSLLPINLY